MNKLPSWLFQRCIKSILNSIFPEIEKESSFNSYMKEVISFLSLWNTLKSVPSNIKQGEIEKWKMNRFQLVVIDLVCIILMQFPKNELCITKIQIMHWLLQGQTLVCIHSQKSFLILSYLYFHYIDLWFLNFLWLQSFLRNIRGLIC